MSDWVTTCVDCPSNLLEEIQKYVEESDAHENQSQFLRYAIRQSLRHRRLELPQEMLDDIDETVEESLVFENRSQYVRAAIRTLQEQSEEFNQSR